MAFKMRKKMFLLFLFTVVTFTSLFKENILVRSHKTMEIKIFLIFMLVEGSGSGRRDRSGSAQIITDPDQELRCLKTYKAYTNPDPYAAKMAGLHLFNSIN
jgi:hypothetical protein